jgi:hypothetical protein
MLRYWRTVVLMIAVAFSCGKLHAQETIFLDNPAAPLSAWYVQADFLGLHRSTGSSAPLLTDPAGATTLANAGAFGFNWDAGPRLAIGRQLDACTDIELVYFGIYHMQATAVVPGPGMIVNSPLVGTSFKADYRSSINSFEANLRHWMNGPIALLAGFRYVNWHETLETTFAQGAVVATPGPTAAASVLTNNNLYGGQIGAEWQRSICGRYGINAYGKAGLFANEAYTRGTIAVGPGTAALAATDFGVAFVGEVGVVGIYQVTDRLSLRLGYTVMWLEGLALAPDQVARINFTAGSATTQSSGGVFLHGVIAGAHWRW